jgi:hypothetical protein
MGDFTDMQDAPFHLRHTIEFSAGKKFTGTGGSGRSRLQPGDVLVNTAKVELGRSDM